MYKEYTAEYLNSQGLMLTRLIYSSKLNVLTSPAIFNPLLDFLAYFFGFHTDMLLDPDIFERSFCVLTMGGVIFMSYLTLGLYCGCMDFSHFYSHKFLRRVKKA